MSSHKPQTIWEMPSFLIRSSAVKNGIWWLALKWYWVCEEGRRSRETGMWRVPICVFACVTGAVCVWERESLKRDVKKETEYRVSCLRAQFGGFSKSCGSKSDRAAKVKQCTGMHEDFYNFTLILHITTRLWSPIVPCLHAHVQLAVPGLRLLVKCLWAALCGFLSLKGPVLLNVDCHDVSSKPQPCLLCVTVTIYFRPLREKQLSFHQCSSLTRTLGLNTVLLLPGQNRHPNGGARPFSQSLGWSKTIKRVGKKMRIDQLKRMPHV